MVVLTMATAERDCMVVLSMAFAGGGTAFGIVGWDHLSTHRLFEEWGWNPATRTPPQELCPLVGQVIVTWLFCSTRHIGTACGFMLGFTRSS